MTTKWKQNRSSFIPYIGLVAVIALFTATTKGGFLAGSNLVTLLDQSYSLILVSLGVTLIYAHGGMDFSVGAVLALSEICGALVFERTGLAWVIVPLCIIVSVGCGFITGIVTVKLRMPPFISSLCMQFACRGIVSFIINTRGQVTVTNLPVGAWYVKLVVLLAVSVGMFVVLGHTKIGKYNKAIGENINTARSSGVNTDKYRLLAYLISGVTLGVAAYFDLLRTGVTAYTTGNGLEMNAILALVLGGLSLAGGYSASIRCAIIGGFIITMLSNGLVMTGVVSTAVGMFTGVIFLGVVMLTTRKQRIGLLPR